MFQEWLDIIANKLNSFQARMVSPTGIESDILSAQLDALKRSSSNDAELEVYGKMLLKFALINSGKFSIVK